MKANTEITATMVLCLDFIQRKNKGIIIRHQGGYWSSANFQLGHSFGTSTIEGLVKRGRLRYTHWKESAGGRRFPIQAEYIPQPEELS